MKIKSLIKKDIVILINGSFMMLPLLFGSCNNHPGSESQLKENVDSFSCAYYNWQFKKAMPYVTESSHKWLKYAASQVHQEDVDLLRNKEEGASYEIGDITYNDDDSTASVMVTASNFIGMDTIGKVSHLVDKATYKIDLKFENDNWKVRMVNLPRSEKKNHD